MKKWALGFLVIGSIDFGADAVIVFVHTALGNSPITARVPALLLAVVVAWLLNRQHTLSAAAKPNF